jgi:hypothetical protein
LLLRVESKCRLTTPARGQYAIRAIGCDTALNDSQENICAAW